jgi:hypothetical protein
MRTQLRSIAPLIVLCGMLAGCSGKPSEPEPASSENKPTPQSSAPAEENGNKSQTESGKQPKASPPGAQPHDAPAAAEPQSKTAGAPNGPPREAQKAAPAAAEHLPPAVPAQAVPASTPVAEVKKVQAKDVYILRGSPIGPVKFEHKLHQERAGNKCETCHHPSKPEKPATAAQQSCLECHTKPLQAGMKTGLQAAFHNPLAKNGTCIDCHKMQNAQGKNAPTKCTDCHKTERSG